MQNRIYDFTKKIEIMNTLAAQFVLAKEWNNHLAHVIKIRYFVPIHMMVVRPIFSLKYHAANSKEAIYITK